jgi:hypothetical protein
MRTAKEKLLDNGIDDEVQLIAEEGFDDALVGVVYLPGLRAVYDYDKMIEGYMKLHGCSAEDAADYINYNLIRGFSYMGGDSPIIYDPLNF